MLKKIAFMVLLVFLSTGYAKADNDKLILISPHWQGIETESTNAFKEFYKNETGRDVSLEWLDQGGTSSDYRYVRSQFEKSPDGIDIDIFFGGGTDIHMKMADSGLLHPYKLKKEQLEKMPQNILGIPIYDPEYRWYGVVLSTFVIMENKMLRKRLKLPEIKRWIDLTNPKLIKRVSMADPRESGSAHKIYEIILQGHGWDKGFQVLTEIGGNVSAFPAGSNQIPKEVVSGNAVFGTVIDFYAFKQVTEIGKDKVGSIIPEDAVVIGADPISILKGAPNLKIAEKFMDFVFSDRGQKLWMLPVDDPEGPGEFSLQRASVMPYLYKELGDRSLVPINPFDIDTGILEYDSEKGSTRWNVVNDLIGAMIIDSHKELAGAWRAIRRSKNKEAALEELGKLPVTEEEALKLAEKWDDQALRNRKISEWTNFAKEKYNRAKELATMKSEE